MDCSAQRDASDTTTPVLGGALQAEIAVGRVLAEYLVLIIIEQVCVVIDVLLPVTMTSPGQNNVGSSALRGEHDPTTPVFGGRV